MISKRNFKQTEQNTHLTWLNNIMQISHHFHTTKLRNICRLSWWSKPKAFITFKVVNTCCNEVYDRKSTIVAWSQVAITLLSAGIRDILLSINTRAILLSIRRSRGTALSFLWKKKKLKSYTRILSLSQKIQTFSKPQKERLLNGRDDSCSGLAPPHSFMAPAQSPFRPSPWTPSPWGEKSH